METLFNNLTKHQESLYDYSSLITTMYHAVSESRDKWIDQNLDSDDLTKIWECCCDLKLIFESASVYPDFNTFTDRVTPNLFTGHTVNEGLCAINKLSRLYFGLFSEKDNSLYQRVQQSKLCNEIEKIIQDSIENKPS